MPTIRVSLASLRLDFRTGLPAFLQVVQQVQRQVAQGRLRAGQQLPTVRELAAILGVNFNTVARAYRLLDEAHIISTQQGRGTYIIEIPPPAVTEKLRHESLEALTQRFFSEAFRLGFSKAEISQMVRGSLRLAKEAQDEEKE